MRLKSTFSYSVIVMRRFDFNLLFRVLYSVHLRKVVEVIGSAPGKY